ncbi:MAG: hypothetical protein ACRYGK_17875, partial [Janthinobacterium lividum]
SSKTTTSTTTELVGEGKGLGFTHKDYHSAVFNGSLSNPLDQKAASTIDKFMTEHDFHHVGKRALDEIAETGYLTKNGETIYVGNNKELMSAVERFRKNDFSLYNKLNDPATPRTTTTTTTTATTVVADVQDVSGPSQYQAARRMSAFQNATGEMLLSRAQMASVAEHGQFTGKNGKVVYAPDGVIAAARKMMEGGGALFSKLESATNDRHDSMLGAGDFAYAVKKGIVNADDVEAQPATRTTTRTSTTTVDEGNDFGGEEYAANNDILAAGAMAVYQISHDVKLLDRTQMQQIADTGSFLDADGKKVDCADLQQAAKRLMAKGGALFDRLEAASNGVHDGKLGAGDFMNALKKGDIGMSEPNQPQTTTTTTTVTETYGPSPRDQYNAARSFANWQDESGNASISRDQMKEIDAHGFFIKEGKKISPPADVVEAAHVMMANGAALFDKVESASTNTMDGKLGSNNFHDAVANRRLQANASDVATVHRIVTTTTTAVEEDPVADNETTDRADLRAGRRLARFMVATGTASLSASQTAEIVKDGKFTDKDGFEHFAAPGVQAAAARLMADGAALFHKYETAVNKQADSIFTPNDFRAAVDSGLVGSTVNGVTLHTVHKTVTTTTGEAAMAAARKAMADMEAAA